MDSRGSSGPCGLWFPPQGLKLLCLFIIKYLYVQISISFAVVLQGHKYLMVATLLYDSCSALSSVVPPPVLVFVPTF